MRAGRDIRHVMAMAMPEAWENVRDLDPEVRGFYRYHSALMEPWDGPAGVIFTDGVGVGAASTATACARCATRCATTGSWRCAPRSAPST